MKKAQSQRVSSDQDRAVESEEYGQEVAKRIKSQASKSHRDYWRDRVIKSSYTVDGESRQTADWHMRVSFKKVRKCINLGTPNKVAAAERAAKYWRDLVSSGWKHADSQLNPGIEEKKPEKVTVGRLIEVSQTLSSVRLETFDSYAKALRKLASDIAGIKDAGKFDAKHGAREWRKKVDAVPLERLTPTAVVAWKNSRMKAAKGNAANNSAAVTVNSILRSSRSLVSKKILCYIRQELDLPSPLWFEDVPLESEPSLRYQSKIDAQTLIADAHIDLRENQPEVFKALILTLVFGLRRSEADALLWSQMDLKKGILSIHDTDFKKLKSKDSVGDISIDQQMISVLDRFRQDAVSGFVLETPGRSRIKEGSRKSRGYRCDATFKGLIDWLKAKRVPGKRPIHTLRKEVGSIIASKQGIYAASRYLRHSDIRITAKLYADAKDLISAGLGGLFAPCKGEDQKDISDLC